MSFTVSSVQTGDKKKEVYKALAGDLLHQLHQIPEGPEHRCWMAFSTSAPWIAAIGRDDSLLLPLSREVEQLSFKGELKLSSCPVTFQLKGKNLQFSHEEGPTSHKFGEVRMYVGEGRFMTIDMSGSNSSVPQQVIDAAKHLIQPPLQEKATVPKTIQHNAPKLEKTSIMLSGLSHMQCILGNFLATVDSEKYPTVESTQERVTEVMGKHLKGLEAPLIDEMIKWLQEGVGIEVGRNRYTASQIAILANALKGSYVEQESSSSSL